MQNKVHKRTLKESEELIERLQKKVFEQGKLLRKMRMSLYYVKEHLKVVDAEIDGMWLHHLDGSDLLVSKSELFDVLHNKVLNERIRKSKHIIDAPLLELKQFIGW